MSPLVIERKCSEDTTSPHKRSWEALPAAAVDWNRRRPFGPFMSLDR